MSNALLWFGVVKVCGSMPYDDSDVKKMIRYQTERKVAFSRSKRISDDVKNLIHCILEAHVERRYTVTQIMQHPWMLSAGGALAMSSSSTRVAVIPREPSGGQVGAAAAVDAMSQNNNSNVDGVWSRLLCNLINNAHSIFPTSSTKLIGGNPQLRQAVRYALESAVDRQRLRTTANRVWPRRRSRLHLAYRRPWR